IHTFAAVATAISDGPRAQLNKWWAVAEATAKLQPLITDAEPLRDRRSVHQLIIRTAVVGSEDLLRAAVQVMAFGDGRLGLLDLGLLDLGLLGLLHWWSPLNRSAASPLKMQMGQPALRV